MENSGQVRLILGEDCPGTPRCPHGPALLMERAGDRFYACSAYRNRRDCDFYHSAGEKMKQSKLFSVSQTSKALLAGRGHREMRGAVERGLGAAGGSVLLCRECARVGEEGAACCGQQGIVAVTREQASRPCGVLKPKARDKKEAQYFFSAATSAFLVDTVSKLGFTDVICVGCPSVFEQLDPASGVNSLLLDLDPRFQAFYPPEKFVWYNFFNGHAFHGEPADTVLRDFLINSEKLVVLLDPPFGAKTDLIWHSLQRLKQRAESLSFSASVSVVWAFPYFMERQVVAPGRGLAMADYRVAYANHKEFGAEGEVGGRKQGSPVRLFTDIPLSRLVLPVAEGYSLCGPCDRWVAKENEHCDECNSCTSKDGRTYVHCAPCGRCVKPTYTHCKTCGRCKLPEHPCAGKEGEEGEQVEKEEEEGMGKKRKKIGKAKNMSISFKKKKMKKK